MVSGSKRYAIQIEATPFSYNHLLHLYYSQFGNQSFQKTTGLNWTKHTEIRSHSVLADDWKRTSYCCIILLRSKHNFAKAKTYKKIKRHRKSQRGGVVVNDKRKWISQKNNKQFQNEKCHKNKVTSQNPEWPFFLYTETHSSVNCETQSKFNAI